MVTMTDSRERLAAALTPVAPPVILDDVYSDDEYERLLGVIEQHGPWPSIMAHHFETVDEVIATTTGVVPEGHGLTLDDIATAHFRGFFGQNSISYYPEIGDIFYNRRFLELVKSYLGAEYAKPQMMLFNICGAHQSGPSPHLDAPSFRGVDYDNTPVWLLNTMAKSGLFMDHRIRKTQVITWWYHGPEGGFTYWPEGPDRPPQRLLSPMWNHGVVVENEYMFHRGDPVGRPEDRDLPGLKHRSMFGYRDTEGDWAITTDGEVIRTYSPDEIRLLVHWSAEVYADLDEAKKVMDHTDDLTHDRVIDTLVSDVRAQGKDVASPSDPFHDEEFIQAVMHTYTIAPTIDWMDEGYHGSDDSGSN